MAKIKHHARVYHGRLKGETQTHMPNKASKAGHDNTFPTKKWCEECERRVCECVRCEHCGNKPCQCGKGID